MILTVLILNLFYLSKELCAQAFDKKQENTTQICSRMLCNHPDNLSFYEFYSCNDKCVNVSNQTNVTKSFLIIQELLVNQRDIINSSFLQICFILYKKRSRTVRFGFKIFERMKIQV